MTNCQFPYGNDLIFNDADVTLTNCNISDFYYNGLLLNASKKPVVQATNVTITASDPDYGASNGILIYGGDLTLNNVDISGFVYGLQLHGDNSDVVQKKI